MGEGINVIELLNKGNATIELENDEKLKRLNKKVINDSISFLERKKEKLEKYKTIIIDGYLVKLNKETGIATALFNMDKKIKEINEKFGNEFTYFIHKNELIQLYKKDYSTLALCKLNEIDNIYHYEGCEIIDLNVGKEEFLDKIYISNIGAEM